MRIVDPSAHGFDWCRKKNEKKKKRSVTPGKTKTLSCHAAVMDRFFNKRSRAYKLKGYKVYYKSGMSKTYY